MVKSLCLKLGQKQSDLENMAECENGSGIRPGVSGVQPVVIRRADLRQIALPQLPTYGVSPRVNPETDLLDGFDINITQLLAPENISVYGAIYGPTIASDFCSSPPPTSFPGADPGTNAIGAVAAENLWNQLCRCNLLPPGCNIYNGLGQCSGIPYAVTVQWERRRIDANGDVEIIPGSLTRECPTEFFDPNQLYGPIGELRLVNETGRSSLEIDARGMFGQPITVNMSDESSDEIISFSIVSIVRCDGLPDDCCIPPTEDPPPPPPIPFPDPTFDFTCDDCGDDGDVTIVFVPCCPGPQGEPGEDGKDASMFDTFAEPIGGVVDFEGALFDDTGGECYGFACVALSTPPGITREPEQLGISGRYDVARVRLGKSGLYTPWITVDSLNFQYIDKMGGPFFAIEAKPRPGVTVQLYVLRKQEETE